MESKSSYLKLGNKIKVMKLPIFRKWISNLFDRKVALYMTNAAASKILNICIFALILTIEKQIPMAVIVANIISSTFNLSFNSKIFTNKYFPKRKSIVKHSLNIFIGSTLDFTIICAVISIYPNVNPIIAKIISIGTLSPLNFIINRFWIHGNFKNP